MKANLLKNAEDSDQGVVQNVKGAAWSVPRRGRLCFCYLISYQRAKIGFSFG